MQAHDSTRPAPPRLRTRRRLLVLVGDSFPGLQDERAAWIAARAQAADVLVVAPTLPVAGERWVIDVDTREAQARANAQSWIDALADQAHSLHGQIGDESPSMAAADALDGFAADEYLCALPRVSLSPAQPSTLHRLRDLFAPASSTPDPRLGHA